MKVLLDECVDWRLARDLLGHDVNTTRQMGWATIKNGELLALASEHFDAFVTVDRNLSFQQNISAFKIAVVVLGRRRTDWQISGRSFQISWPSSQASSPAHQPASGCSLLSRVNSSIGGRACSGPMPRRDVDAHIDLEIRHVIPHLLNRHGTGQTLTPCLRFECAEDQVLQPVGVVTS